MKWTEKEIAFIRNNPKLTIKAMAYKLSRSVSSIKSMRLKMFHADKDHRAMDAFIRENFELMTSREIAEQFKCTRNQIEYRKILMGLKREQVKAVMQIESKPLDGSWHKSYVVARVDPELLLAVNIQRILRGTYR